MISQSRLKTLKNSLNNEFNILTTSYSVQNYIESWMRKNHEYSSGLFTDSRCSEAYRDAVSYIESEVNSRYTKIAEEINKEIDELNSIISYSSNSSSFSDFNLEHLAVGAGAGLGAAILLGGPVGWLVGIGALFGAAYNSSQKKKELINRILDIAEKINNEAINKISDILNKLILPEPKKIAIKKATAPQTQVVSKPETQVLSTEQTAIKNFLEKRGIKYLVHFTDKKNYDSIMKNGILSISEAGRRGIFVNIKDNNISSHKVDSIMRSDNRDYISLSITNVNKDLIRAYRASGRINNVIVIYIDARILWEDIEKDRIYCNMNASKNEVSFGRGLDSFENMFAPIVSQTDFMTGIKTTYDRNRDGRKQNETTNPRAEILFEKRVDPKYFIDPIEEY